MVDFDWTLPEESHIADAGCRQSPLLSNTNRGLRRTRLTWTDRRDREEKPTEQLRPRDGESNEHACNAISFADFVEHKFVPEYVAYARSAGRAHFYGILKHIMRPARVDRAFQVTAHTAKANLEERSLWPYLDSLPLADVTTEHVQYLISVALDRGYSVQTVTHIRNVIRSIFTHAAKTTGFTGANPAWGVTLPAMSRKEAHSLSLDELRRVIQYLRYPEREVALLSVLTDMNVSEICGLQWKHVNLSGDRRRLGLGWVPPMKIAVQMQSYRAVCIPVAECRQRNVAVPNLLSSVLGDIKKRDKFTRPDDFVLASRAGTPISQDNLARRKLKKIGKALGLPWLSWHVFHRAHLELASILNRQLQDELKRAMPAETILARNPRRDPGPSRPRMP